LRKDAFTNALLLLVVIALIAIATRLFFAPHAVYAESASEHSFYVEPGVQMLRGPDGSRQVYGKVVVDIRTGIVWGFPTLGTDRYPFNPLNSKPETSHPFVLGRFAFEDVDK
jgi:hypothetical protein